MLTRWQRPEASVRTPLQQLTSLREEIDRLFDSPFQSWENGTQPFLSGWCPAIDVYEDKDNLTVRAELPGMKKENIDISLHEGVLTLSGERCEDKTYDDAETYRAERFVGRFHRTVALPAPVDPEKVKAAYADGVLTVTLPKTEEAKPKQIQIQQH
jgi:HSP20 family protein